MKPLFWLERSILKQNNKGSAFVQALLAVGIVGVMLYFLSPQVIKHRQQVTKTASIITARLALHSMMDFTLFGIKQRWCFSKDWMPEKCGDSMTAVLAHPRSIERMLMKAETVNFLRLAGVANPDKAPLYSFGETISLKSFSALHPVYKIVSELKGYKTEAVRIEITRDSRGIIPEYGRELYLIVKISLLDGVGKPLQVGGSELTTTSKVGVYPREVGSFALLVAGDLHLDKENRSGVPEAKGDAALKQFPSRNDRVKYPGLIFESPVFVNGAVRLPEAPDVETDEKGLDTIYTPVTFKDKLVLGEGPILRQNVEFQPRTAGSSTDQFWANIRQFGGFQKGVELDGTRDLGLDFLSGAQTSGQTVDPSDLKKCVEYNLSKYDLKSTLNSELRGQILQNTGSKHQYRLGLTDKNRFNPQTGEVDSPSVIKGFLNAWNLDKKESAVAKFRMNFGDSVIVTGEIPDNGTVTLEPKIDLSGLKNTIKRNLADAQLAKDRYEQDLREIENALARAKQDLDQAEDQLREARDKKDRDRIARLEDRINDIERQIREIERAKENKKNDIARAEEQVTMYERQLAAVESKQGIQPKVRIAVKYPKDPNNPNTDAVGNASFRDLEVTFENEEMLVDSNGNPLSLNMRLEAYDVSYFKKYSLRPWSSNNVGTLQFNREGGAIKGSQYLTDKDGRYRGDLPTENAYKNYDLICKTPENSAFGLSDWGLSFAPNSRFSWAFTDKYEDRTDIILDGNNSYRSSGYSKVDFIVKSVARRCIIKSTANFVTGFFTCEKLVIEPRSSELRIIGSFIVTNGIEIDDTAYDAGIRWSTIYHPMATYELRQAHVLKGVNGQDCSTIARYPVWHPYPSMLNVANLYRCNSIVLRSKADPFRWTSVDPDCGLSSSTGTATTCKNRLVHFYVLEISRESGI
ncbi:MAG: hypothetical protein OM95_09235 [Bdellovibrio sp. ArHS]|uniref:hypothetical protein n=1 Tax=Bdellovibrio sp. ArHS TaxID=1569284 RepID=UPI0005824D9E|nr:hypothetical protein [Bdellovibrio sp. ArHS]KHD88321.1 MAG: hypothetical protein OM95_09235 [Bdellovibrio sp. ArHS]